MLTFKLVHLIEYHANTLAAGLQRRVQMSERAGSYRNVSPAELEGTVREIYAHLGTWLLSKRDADIEQRYTAIGARRVQQDVPLSELLWVIVLTKRNLREFVDDVSFPGRAVDFDEKQELTQLLDQFFDQALYSAAVGYEWAAEAQQKANTSKAEAREEDRANNQDENANLVRKAS